MLLRRKHPDSQGTVFVEGRVRRCSVGTAEATLQHSARTRSCWLLAVLVICSLNSAVEGAVGFEKLTDMDYRGNTYYTIRNLTLYECQGWCREEPECAAASFRFVPNLQGGGQETVCLLQNETSANNPSAIPSQSISSYYMVKLRIRSDKVCSRPWTFERLPNHMLRGLDNALIFTSTKEACLAACLNEERFVCRSAEYNYVSLQCQLSEYDRRSVQKEVVMSPVPGVDYFENLCLSGNDACAGERDFPVPSFGVPNDLVNRYIETHFYVDLELMANNADACRRACEIETEILCRSYVYRGPPTGTSYNCQLFHMDHASLPEGIDAFLNKDRPLYDPLVQPGTYFENACRRMRSTSKATTATSTASAISGVVPPPEPPVAPSSGGSSSGLRIGSPDLQEEVSQEPFPPSAFGNIDIAPQTNNAFGISPPSSAGPNGFPDRLPPSVSKPDTSLGSSESGGGDVNCDNTGTCYDVSVQCKDTRIAVQVSTNRPFNGRVYALGRSETCNVDVFNSDRFRLDLTLAGQDCNTRSIGTVYSNTVVVQHHSVVMTKTDKIYKVRCTYDMSSKNITFGMLPIRDPDMISITSAPAAPAPRIRILDGRGQEVETVRIGDRLTFRVEIPNNTPYGIFARNCVAMAKDARSTFKIIDAAGCPRDSAIFPAFTSRISALEAQYEAFRFTESYGVIFQCNVKYCLGECEPAKCSQNGESYDSWGRRRRRRRSLLPSARSPAGEKVNDPASELDPESMTLSQEILVLDFGDEPAALSRSEAESASAAGSSGSGGRRASRPEVDEPGYRTTSSQTDSFSSDGASLLDDMFFQGDSRCPTRSSVLALATACAVLILTYICSIFYVLMKRWMVNNNKVL